MLNRNQLSDLAVFQLIVRHRSFRKAAEQMDVSVSALSHRMKTLEARLGVRLLNRTSRSVAPTAAGALLAEKIAAGLDLIETGLEELQGRVEGLAGSLRLNVLRDAVPLLLAPALPLFRERFPNIEIEIATDDQFVDVTGDGFDAGLRYAGTIPEDMIAVPVSAPLTWIAVAAPGYLDRAGRPRTPPELMAHSCIRIRTGRRLIYHWEFERGSERHALDVPGAVISGSSDLCLEAAMAGVGVAYCLERLAAAHLRAGRLERVLPDWSQVGPPLAFYYPGRRQVPHGLQALIRILRELRPLGG